MQIFTYFKKPLRIFVRLLIVALISAAAFAAYAQSLRAIIDTSKGEIIVQLNERAALTTVANFANLAIRGFYDGLSFHRVERNFMVQGGDPQGNGTGGPGYDFSGEIILHHNQPGIISMANSGPGTDGSQFFLTHLATPHLDGKHSVFGKVVTGMAIVNQLRRRDTINTITIEGNANAVFQRRREQLAQWNKILDAGFPELKPAPVITVN